MKPVMLYVRKQIAAAHFLEDYDGDCARLHGHTFTVEVWCRGPIKPNGIVIDFRKVKIIIGAYDHGCLNLTMPKGWPATAEALAVLLLQRIPLCVRVRVWESSDCHVEVEK